MSCNQDNFYKNYQADDLWRLPLIKPYELKNSAGAKREDFYNDNWHLLFKDKIKANNLFIEGVNVTMINVDSSIIYGYGTKNPGYHFLINCKTGEERIFTEVKQWEQTLDSFGVNYKNIYEAFEVFEDFKNKKKLPWNKEIIKPLQGIITTPRSQ